MPGQALAHGQTQLGCYPKVMLTRGQVARRLGKSIATVRRMEGNQLHPARDAHGVLRFAAEDVERLPLYPILSQCSRVRGMRCLYLQPHTLTPKPSSKPHRAARALGSVRTQ